jgi:hypothetical protein
MNQRRKVAAATAILAVLAVLIGRIVWRVEKNKTRDRVSEASLSVAKMPASLLASPSASSLPPAAPNHDIVTRSDLLASLNHRQITFFGHVVDQFDAPVSGAEIHAQVTYNTGDTSGVTKRTLVTDSGGNFALVGVSGRTLDFNILKPGYNFIAEQDAYDYTAIVPEHKRHHPDPNKPVVLHMWKLQGGESLVEKRKLTKVISDGRPYRFDLMTGVIGWRSHPPTVSWSTGGWISGGSVRLEGRSDCARRRAKTGEPAN